MESKLNLDFEMVKTARGYAKKIALDMQKFIEKHSTVSVERTIARLLGVDGVDSIDRPLPNVLIDHIKKNNGLNSGIAFWLGNALCEFPQKNVQDIAEMVSNDEINLLELNLHPNEKIKEKVNEIAKKTTLKM